MWLTVQLCDSGYADIDMGDPIPGPKIHDARFRKAEDRLESRHGSGCSRAIDSIDGHPRDGRIDCGNRVQLLLKLPDFRAGGTNGEIISRPGGRNTRDLLCRINVDRISIKMTQDLNGAVALLAKGAGSDRKSVV